MMKNQGFWRILLMTSKR